MPTHTGRGRFSVVKPGMVLTIPEEHYMYGTGSLKLRVTAVKADWPLPEQMEWLAVKGVQVRWDGKDGDDREVMVRTDALPEIVRAARAK